MNAPRRPIVAFDDHRGVVTINGVAVSYELFERLTQSTPVGCWLRFQRYGNDVIVESRFDASEVPSDPAAAVHRAITRTT